MKQIHYLILLFVIMVLSSETQNTRFIHKSKSLNIEQLGKNTFRHLSYLSFENFEKIGCNGMVVIDNNEALIIDAPTNSAASKELIDWVEKTLKCKVKGVVVTHFHVDCLGGLNEFHKKKIPSYASLNTIELAKKDNSVLPQNGFKKYLELPVGNKKVLNEFFGEGHTLDNIVSYFPSEKVLFGGCLIKAINGHKGNLADANTNEWSNTVNAVKSKYGKVKIVIPGHGKPGNKELLDYTIDLFHIK